MYFRNPNGVKCTVTLSLEFDAESVELGYFKTVMNGRNWGGFGPKFGIPRILKLLDTYGIRSSFFISGWDAEHYPETVREIVRRGHEIGAHGYLHEDFSKLNEEEEKEVFRKSHGILCEIAGTEPRGFRSGAYGRPVSANTLRLVSDFGYNYDSSFLDDDVPYLVKVEKAKSAIVEIPWAWVLNDISFLSPSPFSSGLGTITPTRTPRWVLEMWKEEFDSLYEDCGFFNLVIHPSHMGWGSRLKLLEGILSFISGYEGVWFATYGELSELFLKQSAEMIQP